MGNFDDLTDEVFTLYAGGEHASALSLAESAFEQFPNRRATLIYWCACLKSLLGEPASALEDLKDGLAAGLWWADPMLREDADLGGRATARCLRGPSRRVWEATARGDV